MKTRLATDDLVFLNAVRALSAAGKGEREIAEGLGLRPEQLRQRVARIRGAVLRIHNVAEAVSGEGDLSEEWVVTVECLHGEVP